MMMMTNKTMESKRLMAFVCKMNECGNVSCFHLQRHLLRLPEPSSQEAVLLRELKSLGEGLVAPTILATCLFVYNVRTLEKIAHQPNIRLNIEFTMFVILR